jgi:propanol-preferring alcohol dehydrogenase
MAFLLPAEMKKRTNKMRAARLVKAGEPLQIDEVPVPVPAFDEVLVEVAACGLCGTDIHLAVDGDLPVTRTPITLGHEASGVVTEVGKGVSNFVPGDRVAMYPAAVCGHCRFCRVGRESLCENAHVYGMSRDGALAQFVTAPARSILRLPDGIPFDIGAIVTDGVSTPFHALRSRACLHAGESVAVIGCGGLGTHAIMLAKLMGAALIIAIDTQTEALERAMTLGADIAINPAEQDPAKSIRQLTNRSGIDVALEFVGTGKTVETALRVLDRTGRAVLVGIGMDRPSLPPLAAFVSRQQSVLGSFGMDRTDIADLFKLIERGRLDLRSSITARYPLHRANEALQRLAGKDTGVVRLVVEPNQECAPDQGK